MPVMSFAVVTKGPAATAGSTPIRFNKIGMTADRLPHVTYTHRGERVRIISARGAEPYEQRL